MDLSILGYVCNLSDTVSGEVDFCPTRSMPLTWEMKLDSSMTTEVSAPSQMQFSRKGVHYKESCEWEYGVQTTKQSRRVTRFWSLTASRGGVPASRIPNEDSYVYVVGRYRYTVSTCASMTLNTEQITESD